MERKDIEELIDIGVLEAKLEVTEKRLAFVLGISEPLADRTSHYNATSPLEL